MFKSFLAGKPLPVLNTRSEKAMQTRSTSTTRFVGKPNDLH
ncbi:unnamed protein product [Cuscuta epithymum]|uniref:Uncharacterized protein n=1 Tax=Cuscuta epithymum TaxID=186058 RepID=A0AAV0EWQ0_9ASTE|nr:unnamed protein product [Cuscuta epithymum]CAH9127560.1 unnamed protein product [Cuscuta epithymum]